MLDTTTYMTLSTKMPMLLGAKILIYELEVFHGNTGEHSPQLNTEVLVHPGLLTLKRREWQTTSSRLRDLGLNLWSSRLYQFAL